MKCPNTKCKNRETTEFFRVYGQSIISEITCAKCVYVYLSDFTFCDKSSQSLTQQTTSTQSSSQSILESFTNSWYDVNKLLGDGGKKVFSSQNYLLEENCRKASRLYHFTVETRSILG